MVELHTFLFTNRASLILFFQKAQLYACVRQTISSSSYYCDQVVNHDDTWYQTGRIIHLWAVSINALDLFHINTCTPGDELDLWLTDNCLRSYRVNSHRSQHPVTMHPIQQYTQPWITTLTHNGWPTIIPDTFHGQWFLCPRVTMS